MNETQAITDLTLSAHQPVIEHIEGVPHLIHSDRLQVKPMTSLMEHPLRTEANVRLHTLQNLHLYLVAQTVAGCNPVVFANRQNLTFTAFLAYHGKDTPSWLDHQARVTLQRSDQLKDWEAKANQFMSQEAFAEFLDLHSADIKDPTPTTVLDFVEKLECTRKETFKSAVRQTTGEVTYAWTKENSQSESITIIDAFTLAIPVWQRGERIAITAKLHHRIDGPQGEKPALRFRYRLENLERVTDRLWEEQLAFLRNALENVAAIYEGEPPTPPEVD